MTKKWKLHKSDSAHVARLVEGLGLSPVTATVLVNRGFVDVEEARQWLARDQTGGHAPFLMADMDRAIHRLHQAILHQEKICCYCDYDVDGISATSLYLIFLRQQGARVDYYIPDRKSEGYGLNEEAVRRLAGDGVNVLVTIDCGTSSHKEVELANALGLDVIITDHHQILDKHPEAYAFLNPQRTDCRYPFKGLCSGGLAYKVATAYASKYGSPDFDVTSLADLAALATIADMVPLEDENRCLVREGLHQITRGTRLGVHALKQATEINGDCTEGMVAFRLAPTINAAGRLAHAGLGVELFTSESTERTISIAKQLDGLNRQRREIEHGTVAEAITMIDAANIPGAIVVGDRGWHVGVVGIVASRLVERFYRPSVVISFDEQGFGRGSVRSVPGVNVCELLSQCADLLEGFGGHPAAAGLQIREVQFPAFQARMARLALVGMAEEARIPVLRVDAAIALQQIAPTLIRELEQLHPYGMGNPEPQFLGEKIKVLEQRVVGEDHLKLVVRQGTSVPMDCIGFRMGLMEEFQRLQGRMVDMVFIAEMNRWKSMDRIQLRIRDLKVRKDTAVSIC